MMLIVVIAALDFSVIRAELENDSPVGGRLLLFALPMANALAIALLMGRIFPDDRSFIVGFVVCGAIAMVPYIVLATSIPDEAVAFFANRAVRLLESWTDNPWLFMPAIALGYLLLVVSPQLLVALIGGVLFRKFNITLRMSHRPHRTVG
jgi:hypothetical protein